MPTLTSNQYRLLIIHGRRQKFSDKLDNEELKIPAGVDAEIAIAIARSSSNFYGLEEVVSAKMEVKQFLAGGKFPLPGTAALIQKTILAADITNLVAAADWADDSAQNMTFALTAAETALPLGGEDEASFALIFSGILDTGAKVTFGWGTVKFVQDGTGSDPDVDPVDPAYVTDGDLAAYRTIARSIDHLREFTGLTGGTATDLDSIATTGLPLKTTASLIIADALQVWQLQAGTDAENAAGGIVRPDDYAASTNEKIWVRVL